MRKILGALLVVGFLGACTEGHVDFPVSEAAQQDLPSNVEVVRLSTANVAAFKVPEHVPGTTLPPEPDVWNYKVGVGDVLSIDVFDHPELTLPGGPMRSAAESGFRVQADGAFYYPFAGQVRAAGRSTADIREELREKLASFLPNPQLEVRVAAYNSQAVVVSGEVSSPSRLPLTAVPLTLLEAVSAAGGANEAADTTRVTLRRGNNNYNINLDQFLSGPGKLHNPVLRSGDIVVVPRRRTIEAYLLGQVLKPATIDLSGETVTLTQALTRQGGLHEMRADARGVFVFRKRGEKITVFQVEMDSPTGLVLGTEFSLAPQDVIYVTRSPIGRWNDTITRLLPSISVTRAVNDIGN